MRRRLIVLLALLMGCVLAALSVPFGLSIAATRTQEAFVDRLQDTALLAGTAQRATTDVSQAALREDVAAYAELYGITAAVIGRGGTTWAIAGPQEQLVTDTLLERRGPARLAPATSDEPADEIWRRLSQAGDGHQSTSPATVWPWSTDPIVVAVPVRRGDNIVAVALTVSDTGPLRALVARDLSVLVLGDLAAMVLLIALAARLAHWVLRPVYVLDAAARAISSGDRSVRVDGATGPVELRRLSTTFNNMAAAVDLAMQRQEAFVADASHQLRNPLAALMLRLDALGIGLDDRQKEQLRFAREEASRLEAILAELLELATAVHVAAHPTEVVVAQLAGERLDAWQPLADRRQVLLVRGAGMSPAATPAAAVALPSAGPARATTAAPPVTTLARPRSEDPADGDGRRPVRAFVDPVLISSALDAVLDNALKFTPAGGRVTVDVRGDDEAASVVVADTGPGLSPEDLAHVGDRFWRSAASQNVPGSGLGLSIARTLLSTTGAQLRFAPGQPHGLVVTIQMPLAPTTRDAPKGVPA